MTTPIAAAIAAMIAPPRPQVSGHFTMLATKLDGTQRVVADWFDNLVTDGGLNRMGTNNWRDLCVVGTGSNAPAVSDAQLQTTKARTSGGAPNVPGPVAQTSAPYFIQTSAGYRFTAGSAAGNLTEVGIGWSTGSGTTDYALFSRALIKDGFGNPTTVTVLGDEVLDVYYAIRIYPPTTDATYSITISSVTYACVSRAAAVTNATAWQLPNDSVYFRSLYYSYNQPTCFNGDIGTIVGTPSGVSSSTASIANTAYSNNSLRRDATLSWGLNDGNLSGGIKSILYQTSVGMYQTSFTPAIPKDSTKVLSLGVRVGWARRP